MVNGFGRSVWFANTNQRCAYAQTPHLPMYMGSARTGLSRTLLTISLPVGSDPFAADSNLDNIISMKLRGSETIIQYSAEENNWSADLALWRESVPPPESRPDIHLIRDYLPSAYCSHAPKW